MMQTPHLNDAETEVAFKLYEYLEMGQEWVIDDQPEMNRMRKGLKQICEDCGSQFVMTFKYFMFLGFLEGVPPDGDEIEGCHHSDIPVPKFSSKLMIGGALIGFVRNSITAEWSEPKTPQKWAKEFDVSDRTFKRMRDRGEIRCRQVAGRKLVINVEDLPEGVKKTRGQNHDSILPKADTSRQKVR